MVKWKVAAVFELPTVIRFNWRTVSHLGRQVSGRVTAIDTATTAQRIAFVIENERQCGLM
jgi:hypothetical protein